MNQTHLKDLKSKLPSEKFWFTFLLLVITLAYYLVHVDVQNTSYSPFNRTWGFDQLVYYSLPVKIIGALIIFAFLVPSISLIIRNKWKEIVSRHFPTHNKIQILWSFALAVLFYLLSEKYYFLGDFDIRMIQCMKGEYVSTEYLTMWGLHHLALLFAKFGCDTESFFEFYSIGLGFIFVLLAFKLSIQLSEHAMLRWLLFGCIVGSSTMLLFSGYVEIYASPAVLLIWFALASIRYLNENSSFTYPFVIWILALASHLIAIAALPALLSLLYLKGKLRLGIFRQLIPFYKTMLILLIALLGIIIVYTIGHSFLMCINPPSEHPNRMTLFSFKHIWEFLNGQFLCSGLAIILIFIQLSIALYKSIQVKAFTVFFLLNAFSFLILTYVSDLQRGSGDWDIMSFSALPLNISAVLLAFDLYSSTSKTAYYLGSFLFITNVLNAVLWLHINHTDRSIQKITSMLETDPASYYDARISGGIQLALCFQNNNLIQEKEKIALRLCNTSKKEEVAGCVIYLQTLSSTNRTEEAVSFAEDLLLNRSSTVYEAYIVLLHYYDKKNDTKKTLFYLNKLFDSFIAEPQAFLYSQNYKQSTLVGLFKALHYYGGSKVSEQRRTLIRATIKQLQEYKFVKE